MKKQIANIVTGSRILCSIMLLHCPIFSVSFYALYLYCGITDMVDGTIARITGTAGTFGAKLDTVADAVFLMAAALRFLPTFRINAWLWVWITAIFFMKISSILYSILRWDRMPALHTAANKITGLLLFCLPLTAPLIDLQISTSIVCTTATCSALQEWYRVRTGYDSI